MAEFTAAAPASIRDYTNASSAIAELRAYGALLHAFRQVSAVPTRSSGKRSAKTPDFAVELPGGNTVYVKVHAKQWDADQAESLDTFMQKPPSHPAPGSRIATSEHLTQPVGKPKTLKQAARNEWTIENMISRIAQIKSRDEQVPTGAASILWLDFQDETWAGFGLREHLYPVMSWNGAVSSGGFWHAFYGRKGMRLLENADVCIEFVGGTVEMQHEGRFYQNDRTGQPAHRAAGIIVSLSEECVLLQNPNAEKELPREFIVSAIELPWFRLEKSWLNWPQNDLRQKLEMAVAAIPGRDSVADDVA